MVIMGTLVLLGTAGLLVALVALIDMCESGPSVSHTAAILFGLAFAILGVMAGLSL